MRGHGILVVGAGFLFAAMVVWQHAAGSGSAGTGTGVGFTLTSTGFLVAEAGFVALAVGLVRARPAGPGRVAAVFPALIGLAWTAVLGTTLLDVVGSGSAPGDVLGPVGVTQGVGLVGLGVGTALAQRWTRWRRWFPLGFAVFYTGAAVVPAILGIEPATVTEAVWALGYAGLGLALTCETAQLPGRSTVGLGVLAGLVVAAATVVTFTSGSAVTPQPAGPGVLHQGPIGSVDTVPAGPARPRVLHEGPIGSVDSVPTGPAAGLINGSADGLEHQLGPHHGVIGGSADELEHRVGSHDGLIGGSADGLEHQFGSSR